MHDTDDGVDDAHEHEEHVLVRARQKDEYRKNHIDKVEERADIATEDTAVRARFYGSIRIHLACSLSGTHLFRRKTLDASIALSSMFDLIRHDVLPS